jgi:very-short-patch-repair endonuclease
VSVPIRGHHRVGIQVHRAPALNDADRAEREEIPVTAVPRTLLDIAATAPRRLDRAIERSEQLGSFDLGATDSLLVRTAGHPGAGRLRQAVAVYREPAFTRSHLERLFLALVRKTGLPRPSVNTFVAGFELDMYWPRERFAVELDGYETHGTRAAFERDPVRQEDLKLAGIEIVRITYRRITAEPELVAERLAALLERRRRELRAVALGAAPR